MTLFNSIIFCSDHRYGVNLEDAKTYGIRKAVVSGGGMGVVFMIIFASYALAFWYGSSLVRSGEYTAGKMLIVSIHFVSAKSITWL